MYRAPRGSANPDIADGSPIESRQHP